MHRDTQNSVDEDTALPLIPVDDIYDLSRTFSDSSDFLPIAEPDTSCLRLIHAISPRHYGRVQNFRDHFHFAFGRALGTAQDFRELSEDEGVPLSGENYGTERLLRLIEVVHGRIRSDREPRSNDGRRRSTESMPDADSPYDRLRRTQAAFDFEMVRGGDHPPLDDTDITSLHAEDPTYPNDEDDDGYEEADPAFTSNIPANKYFAGYDGYARRRQSSQQRAETDERAAQEEENDPLYDDDEPLPKVQRDSPPPPPPSAGGGIAYSLDFSVLHRQRTPRGVSPRNQSLLAQARNQDRGDDALAPSNGENREFELVISPAHGARSSDSRQRDEASSTRGIKSRSQTPADHRSIGQSQQRTDEINAAGSLRPSDRCSNVRNPLVELFCALFNACFLKLGINRPPSNVPELPIARPITAQQSAQSQKETPWWPRSPFSGAVAAVSSMGTMLDDLGSEIHPAPTPVFGANEDLAEESDSGSNEEKSQESRPGEFIHVEENEDQWAQYSRVPREIAEDWIRRPSRPIPVSPSFRLSNSPILEFSSSILRTRQPKVDGEDFRSAGVVAKPPPTAMRASRMPVSTAPKPSNRKISPLSLDAGNARANPQTPTPSSSRRKKKAGSSSPKKSVPDISNTKSGSGIDHGYSSAEEETGNGKQSGESQPGDHDSDEQVGNRHLTVEQTAAEPRQDSSAQALEIEGSSGDIPKGVGNGSENQAPRSNSASSRRASKEVFVRDQLSQIIDLTVKVPEEPDPLRYLSTGPLDLILRLIKPSVALCDYYAKPTAYTGPPPDVVTSDPVTAQSEIHHGSPRVEASEEAYLSSLKYQSQHPQGLVYVSKYLAEQMADSPTQQRDDIIDDNHGWGLHYLNSKMLFRLARIKAKANGELPLWQPECDSDDETPRASLSGPSLANKADEFKKDDSQQVERQRHAVLERLARMLDRASDLDLTHENREVFQLHAEEVQRLVLDAEMSIPTAAKAAKKISYSQCQSIKASKAQQERKDSALSAPPRTTSPRSVPSDLRMTPITRRKSGSQSSQLSSCTTTPPLLAGGRAGWLGKKVLNKPTCTTWLAPAATSNQVAVSSQQPLAGHLKDDKVEMSCTLPPNALPTPQNQQPREAFPIPLHDITNRPRDHRDNASISTSASQRSKMSFGFDTTTHSWQPMQSRSTASVGVNAGHNVMGQMSLPLREAVSPTRKRRRSSNVVEVEMSQVPPGVVPETQHDPLLSKQAIKS